MDPDGAEPVREFIDGLDPKRRAALLRQLDRLNDLSDAMPHLPFPAQLPGLRRAARVALPHGLRALSECCIGGRSA